MLFLSKTGGPAAFAVVAALVLVAGFVVAFRPQIGNAAMSGVAAIAVLGLVAGGVAAALAGERDMEPHHTTTDLAAEGECDTAEETEVDEHASQNVADKANIIGEVILREDGTLVARALGISGESDQLVVTRSNPTNVLFSNKSEEERRLVLNLGEQAGGRRDDRGDDPRRVRSDPALHGTRRGWGQPAADVHRSRGRRRWPRARTRSPCRESTIKQSRCWSHEDVVTRRLTRRAAARRPRRRGVAAPPRRVCRRGAAGHLAARWRQRPGHPQPAVAGVRDGRGGRADRRRRRRLVRVALPRPRPADPEAVARAAGTRDRASRSCPR